MKLLFIFLLLVSSLTSFANSLGERRTKIINIINEELSEVSRLNKQRGSRDPDLLLRMAELNLEKARLWREKENADFLALPEKTRRKVNKKVFYKKSAQFFTIANKICLNITRKFRSYSKLGEVYYILGFNAKEANKEKTASKYLARAVKSTRDPKTKVKSQISLAEVSYNQQKYKKAIPLYEKSLRRYKDKWWTKDSFNLAWSYFRTNQYSKAISKMEEVFRASSSSKYIDMRAQVERDIGLFYATANRIDDGVKFYKKIGVNFTDQLLIVAGVLTQQGKYARANLVLNRATKYEKRESKLNEIYIEQIILFEKFSKYSNHEIISKKLYNSFKRNSLTENQIKTFRFQLAKLAAILQKQAISKTYRRLPKVKFSKANQAILYFGYLSEIEKNKEIEYNFLQGETAYAVGMKSNAYNFYKMTYEKGEKQNISKFRGRSIDGMIAALGTKKNTDLSKNVYVFNAYLKHYPRGKKAKSIYTRLFNAHLATNNYTKAKETLDNFKSNYGRDYKTQEAMIAKLMDINRKARDNDKIRVWISDIDAGKYKVSKKYSLKLKELLTTIQMEDVQKKRNSGDKRAALIGYHEVVKDKYSTKKSKINAKYNLAAMYYELNNGDESYKWAVDALGDMGSSDVLKFSQSFIAISDLLFTSLEFEKSADLSDKFLQKVCYKKTKKKNSTFKNTGYKYLAYGDVKATERLINLGKKCKVRRSIITNLEYELMKEYRSLKQWPRYEYYVSKLQKNNKYYNLMIDEYIFLVKLHSKFQNSVKIKKYTKMMWKLYFKAKKRRADISMSSLDEIANVKLRQMDSLIAKINLVRFEFPEKVFAKRQKTKFELLTKLTAMADEIQAIGSGEGIVKSYKYLEDIHRKVSQEILNFVPKGKSPEYIKGFKKDFDNVGKQLLAAASQYRSEALRAIENNTILNRENVIFQLNDFPVKFFGDNTSVLMDRGGN